ncbi:hypothetical protein FACS189490_07370 [Clostridia bacterium]|nr:hypothetical protein FACS189490_07370 [Clostridia bacterium]
MPDDKNNDRYPSNYPGNSQNANETHWYDEEGTTRKGKNPNQGGTWPSSPIRPGKPENNHPNRPTPGHTQPGRIPPSYTPRPSDARPFVDASRIGVCVNRYAYIWLKNGQSFWLFVVKTGRNSVAGYKWNYYGWTYATINTQNIKSFFCTNYGG